MDAGTAYTSQFCNDGRNTKGDLNASSGKRLETEYSFRGYFQSYQVAVHLRLELPSSSVHLRLEPESGKHYGRTATGRRKVHEK